MKTRTRQPAFTLVEVILAVTLAGLLMAGIFGLYWRAVQVRETVLDRTAAVDARRLVMDRIASDLQSAFPGSFGVRGGPGWMQVVAADLPGPVAWVEPGMMDQPPAAEQDLRIVGYGLRIVEDEDGWEVIKGIQRTCRRRLRPTDWEELAATIERRLLDERIRFVGFRYWDGLEWVPTWDRGVPRAVEVRLGARALPENVDPIDYPYETFDRVVHLPAADRPAEEEFEEGGLP